MYQRTFIGMDVHARSVQICAITPETGEVQRASLAMDHHGVRDWIVAHGSEISTLRAVYEAGPTGYGLARTFDCGRNPVRRRGPVPVDPAFRGQGEDRCPGR